jgi:hypothetical protein
MAVGSLSLLRSPRPSPSSARRRAQQIDHVDTQCERQLHQRLDRQVLCAALDALHVAGQHVQALGQGLLCPAAPGPDLGDPASDAIEKRRCLGKHARSLRTRRARKHSRIGACYQRATRLPRAERSRDRGSVKPVRRNRSGLSPAKPHGLASTRWRLFHAGGVSTQLGEIARRVGGRRRALTFRGARGA